MKTLIGLMLVKNEEWILEASAKVALKWCDRLIISDDGSVDDTRSIITKLTYDYPDRVWVYYTNPNDRWLEMYLRQNMLDIGRELGGTHFALIDADEFITANLIPEIRDYVFDLDYGAQLTVQMYPVYSDHQIRTDTCIWTRSTPIVAFADLEGLHWKPAGDYQHHHRAPYGINPKGCLPPIEGGMLHYQWYNWARITAKHAWYKMREAIDYPNKSKQRIDAQYSMALNRAGLQLSHIPESWMHEEFLLIKDEKLPWYTEECKKLLATYGRDRFKNLNLFGIVSLK